MKIRKTKGNQMKHIIQGLLSIIDGLTRVITFGYFWTDFQYKYVIKMLKQR
jgi:hypothetical protein